MVIPFMLFQVGDRIERLAAKVAFEFIIELLVIRLRFHLFYIYFLCGFKIAKR